jgi:hypothetical protein
MILTVTPEVISSVKDIYTLLALIIVSSTYIFTIIYHKNLYKRQNAVIMDKFEEQNKNLIRKLDELREARNTLDLQSSMDMLELVYTKSMLRIMDGVKLILEENNVYDEERKPIILAKIKSVINTQYDDDLITMSRIYYRNMKLSHYFNETDRTELTNTIFNKINDLDCEDKKKNNNIRQYIDIMDYIRNKYSHMIQSAQLMISK